MNLEPTRDVVFFADETFEDIARKVGQYEELDLLPEYFAAPIFVLWELTGKCPLNCIYCYVDCPKPSQDLSEDQIWRVARELIDLKVFSICVSGGEPTSHPLYGELIGYLAEHWLTVGTVTNGWYMTPELARRMAKYCNSIQISIDGPDAESHDRVRRRKGSFDRAVAAVKMLQDAGVAKIHVSCVATRFTIDRFEEMIGLCSRLGVSSLRTQPLAIVGAASSAPDCEPTPDQYERLVARIKAHPREENGLTVDWGDPTLHMRVGADVKRVFGARITSEGLVGFTPYLDWFFGSLREQPLGAIWDHGLRTAWTHPLVRQRVSHVTDMYGLRPVPGLPDRVDLFGTTDLEELPNAAEAKA